MIAGGSESGRKHAFFSSVRVGHQGYISGMRADAPIEIAVDLEKAVESGVDFILTDSDGVDWLRTFHHIWVSHLNLGRVYLTTWIGKKIPLQIIPFLVQMRFLFLGGTVKIPPFQSKNPPRQSNTPARHFETKS